MTWLHESRPREGLGKVEGWITVSDGTVWVGAVLTWVVLRITRRTSVAAIRLSRMPHMATDGPSDSKNWPISHGNIIPPTEPPAKKKLVTRPVITIRLSARESITGMIEAIPKPVKTLPTHKTRLEPDHIRINATPSMAVAKSPRRI
jgi:hypothetical protein